MRSSDLARLRGIARRRIRHSVGVSRPVAASPTHSTEAGSNVCKRLSVNVHANLLFAAHVLTIAVKGDTKVIYARMVLPDAPGHIA